MQTNPAVEHNKNIKWPETGRESVKRTDIWLFIPVRSTTAL